MSKDFFSHNKINYNKKDLDEIYRQQSMDSNPYGHTGFVSRETKEEIDKRKILEREKLESVYGSIYNLGSITPVSHSHYRQLDEIDTRNTNIKDNSRNYIKKDLDEETMNRRLYRNIQNVNTKTYEQKLMDILDEIRDKKITDGNRERYTVEVSAIMYITSCKFIPEFTKDDIVNAYFDVKEMMNKKDKALGGRESVKSFSLIFARAIWFLRGNIKEKSIITSHSAHAINTNFLIKDSDDLKVF
ncbi:hypothetical protein CPT_Madawaska_243 [Staphylococcus phage Madawaska]|nr:hypothetical protein CPT_Madawaska_243 [Staphylococcus phage Madawaska]